MATIFWQTPAHAQRIDPLNVEPDANGVDMLSARVSRPVPVLQIPAAPNLRLERLQLLLPVATGSESGIDPSQGSVQLNPGTGASESFQCIEQNCWPRRNSGSTLTMSGSGALRSMTYMQGGTGMRIVFNSVGNLSDNGATESFSIYPSTITWPSGERLTFSYNKVAVPGGTRHRPWRVVSNLGYEMRLYYRSTDVNTAQWAELSQASIFELGVTSVHLARHIYGTDGSITDLAGRVWSCCRDALDEQVQVAAVTQSLPGESGNSFVATASTNNRYVSQIVSDGVAWNYNAVETTQPGRCGFEHCDLERVTITGPLNFERVVINDVPSNEHQATVVESVTNRINSTTTYTTNYSYDVHRRLTQITYPRGNAVEVEYDDFGNIITRREHPTSGTDLIQRAEFNTPSTPPGPDNPGCANVTCFFPTRTRDAAGYWTDYLWGTHGGNVKTLEPAGANNLRRLTHRLYSTSGGITRLTSERTCGVSSGAAIASITCPNTTATQVTNYAYWGSTMLPSSVTRTNGAGSLSAVTTYSYDTAGRTLTEDGPLTGTDDASYYRYDTAGRRTWSIGPVGASAPRRSATRTVYRDADDQPTRVESGYVMGPTSTNVLESHTTEHSYNSRRLRTLTEVTDNYGSGALESVTQFTYDARNQLLCEARRMNPAQFTSLPSSACNLDTTGSMGPDRIQRHWYDRFGRRYLTRGGYRVLNGGNGEDVFRMSWTNNGRVNWRQDGNGNRTNYSYDVYDRLYRTTFPDGTYEQLTYDARNLVTQLRNRRGQTITSSYDNAGRLTQTSYSTSDPSITYSYDGLGRETQVARSGRSTLNYRYDALGRRDRVTQTGQQVRQVNYQYDLAGRRTRLTWPDGFYVTYDYTPAGQVTAISENGGTALVSYVINAFGQLRQLQRANGVTTYVNHDGFSRPTRINQTGLTYIDFTYNPASQILTRAISNDAHVWNHHATVNRNYAVNNLNQYTSAGGTTFSYDNSGNLTRSGTDTYAYDPANRMTSATVGGGTLYNLRYDGLGRLYRTWGNGEASTYYTYDGNALIAEYSHGGTLLRRYIQGPGDRPILWYEGASTAASNRRFLHADERGSIVAITDNAGATVNLNRYDDWGIPAPGNDGRFGYTGQIWLDAIGLSYYKARMYSPQLGRFMQTDPIGYEDGMNMYAYVGNDPINYVDPSGTARVCTDVTGSNIDRCVWVDGDGDGNSRQTAADEGLTQGQVNSIGNDFHGFIARNNGRDISSEGRPIDPQSTASESDIAMVRVVSQFVGASGLAENWNNIQRILVNERSRIGFDTADVYYQPYAPDGVERPYGRITFTGGYYYLFWHIYDSPSNIARALFHEVGHTPVGVERNHHAVDAVARRQLRASGLGGGGCWSYGFSRCK